MTLRIYDVKIDDWRDATQLDLDVLGEVAKSYGLVREAIQQEHAALQDRIKRIKSKAGEPAS